MKKNILYLLTIIFSILSLNMGTMGEKEKFIVPEVKSNFVTTIIDQNDNSIELDKFSIDGKVFIHGKLGLAEICVDLNKASNINFIKKDNDLFANLTLKDGKILEIIVDKKITCFGKSSFGDVRIYFDNIKSISFKPKTN
ncbi:MAG: hypothetical protein HQK76_09560 [Desulfobacterales bacterium]|nr:hypothetical protein [Desulfobacterales bacterium]